MIYSCVCYFIEAALHNRAVTNEMDADGFKGGGKKKRKREWEMKGKGEAGCQD